MYQALIVDDEPRSRNAIEQEVDWKKCGIRKVYQASGMEEAIQKLRECSIQVLICDIEMPNGSGLELVEWTKNNGLELGVIFVTCHPEFEYMRKAIQLHCYDYILKPIHYKEFEDILSHMVHKMEGHDFGKEEIGIEKWDQKTPVEQIIYEHRQSDVARDIEKEVKQFIKEHLREDITVTLIAEQIHFNPQYLMRSFKSKTGQSITEYITTTRVQMAKKLLKETSLSIKEIADLVGYKDYAYFTRVFKKETEQAPTQYRGKQI